jgi:signal peptidase I
MGGRGARLVTATGPTGPDATVSDADATAVLPAPPTPTPPSPPEEGEPRRTRRGKPRKPPHRVALEWVVLIAIALAIAFLIKTFLFQAFYIPSPSMEPTLNVGDRVLVNKLSYDLHDVNRGDIVVFEAPEEEQRASGIEDLVKRVIGLPGETVSNDPSLEAGAADNCGVFIDGKPLREPYISSSICTRFDDVPAGCQLPDNTTAGCVVPPGHIFVLGDNREHSKDGRVFGPVPESSIVGRVFVRIWPLDDIGLL